MGFDTVEHERDAGHFYPEKLHIIGVDMKRPEIMIDGEIFELISLEGHSVGHTGVVTPDGIAVSVMPLCPEDVLNVSKLRFYGKCEGSTYVYGRSGRTAV